MEPVDPPMNIPAAQLRSLAVSVLQGVRVPPDVAVTVADVVVDTELRGIESHGMAHLVRSVDQVRSGRIRPNARWTVETEGDATALIDGQRGFGQVAAKAAMEMAIDKAERYGVATVVVKNNHTFGAAAWLAEMAVKRDMIGLVFSNTGGLVAPTGGTQPLLGNSPFAIGVPSVDVPFVLDMACSVMARGNIDLAAQKGERLPPGVALDEEGRPTEDPRAALAGALLPFGGYKGYGLALGIEFLTGLLSGAPLVEEDIPKGFVRPAARSQTFCVMDVARFTPVEPFKERVARYLHQLTEARHLPGEQIVYPGLGAAKRREILEREGIRLSPSTLEGLRRVAGIAGIDPERWLPRTAGDRH